VLACALVLSVWRPGVASAQVVIPNTFVAGTVISESQVNANFTALGNAALNRTAGVMTGVLKIPDGAAGAPSLALVNDPTTGLYRPGPAGTIAVAISGSAMLTINASGLAWGGGAAVASSDAVANAVLTSGSYADPAWLTSVAATKLTGTVADARLSANVPLKNGTNAFSGSTTFTGGVGLGGTYTLNAGTGHDVAIGGAAIIDITAGAPATVTGLAGGVAGRVVVLVNRSGGGITVAHENAGSVAANRYSAADGASNISLGAGFATRLIYDGTASRWRLF
jgi:hypothetical protein